MPAMTKYRPNVAAIMQRADGKILVAERADVTNAWQFPQGGLDAGEDLISALQREVEEEIGVSRTLYVIKAARTNYRYKFPNGHRKSGEWCGQEQTYFLCQYLGTDDHINLGLHGREFAQIMWIDPHEYQIKWLPKFKREVYRAVFRDFFGVKLTSE